jgi:hypothetical protein
VNHSIKNCHRGAETLGAFKRVSHKYIAYFRNSGLMSGYLQCNK